MTKHAVFAPSSAPRWANCTSSYYVHQQEVDSTGGASIYAREGTILHEICAKWFNDALPLNAHLGYREEYGEDEIVIDQESLDACQEYIDIVTGYAIENEGSSLRIEEKVEHFSDMWGTTDAELYCPYQHHLHVFDLKMGRGEEVFAENNEQLLTYGVGSLNRLDPFDKLPKFITLHIIQPRLPSGDSHKMWTLDVGEAYKLFERILVARQLILEGFEHTHFTPGEKQCRWCSYAGGCKALADFNMATAKVAFSKYTDLDINEVAKQISLTGTTFHLSMADKLALKPLFPIFEMWMKKINESVLDEAVKLWHSGKKLDGYKIVESTKHRQWRSKDEAIELLTAELDEKAYTVKVLTPSQAEKALGKKITTDIQQLIFKPKGDPVLAPDKSNKPEMQLTAPEAFKEYAGEK